MGKATSKTLPAFFKMMGRQSSPGSWRIETVGKRNSHGRRYVGIARLEVQIPGHEDETIGLYIDSLGWQGVSFGCLSIAILIFISTVIKLSYCHHRHIVIIVTLSSSSHRYHHHIDMIITLSSSLPIRKARRDFRLRTVALVLLHAVLIHCVAGHINTFNAVRVPERVDNLLLLKLQQSHHG